MVQLIQVVVLVEELNLLAQTIQQVKQVDLV
jgi:hypothetical protein